MKTCEPHNYSPPSLCPNCRIRRRRMLKARAKAGWATKKHNQNSAERARLQQQDEAYRQQGWTS